MRFIARILYGMFNVKSIPKNFNLMSYWLTQCTSEILCVFFQYVLHKYVATNLLKNTGSAQINFNVYLIFSILYALKKFLTLIECFLQLHRCFVKLSKRLIAFRRLVLIRTTLYFGYGLRRYTNVTQRKHVERT